MGLLLAPTESFGPFYCRTQDFHFLAVKQMIVEIWIGSIFCMVFNHSVSWLVVAKIILKLV